MTCKQLTEFIMAYLNHELTPGQRMEFDSHLSQCQTCVEYLASYQRTVEVSKLSFAELECVVARTIPEDLVKSIMAAKAHSARSVET